MLFVFLMGAIFSRIRCAATNHKRLFRFNISPVAVVTEEEEIVLIESLTGGLPITPRAGNLHGYRTVRWAAPSENVCLDRLKKVSDLIERDLTEFHQDKDAQNDVDG
jgi:hypothetical protein